MNFDKVPQELKDLPQWVCWAMVQREGKATKLPIDPKTGRLASSTDRKTWGTFDAAVKASSKYNGIGFVFSEDDPYFGVDLDGHIDHDLIKWFGTYAERSQSGTGAHIIGKGKLNRTGRKVTTGDHQGFEAYSKGRYFVVTGDILHPEPIRDCQRELDEFCANVFPPDKGVDLSRFLPTGNEPEPDILDRIRDSAQGGKFDRLWVGAWQDYHSSQSEADAALMSILRFWTGGNKAESIRLFQRSGLMRKKAERKDYLDRTFNSIDSGEVYEPLPVDHLPAPAILQQTKLAPWRKVTIDHVERAIQGTILEPMCKIIQCPNDPPIPLEVALMKALALCGCALSQKRDKPRGLGDYIARGSDAAKVRIMSAGGQVCNFYCLIVGTSAVGKDIGGLVHKAAMQFKWLVGDAGSEEGLADAYIAKPNGLLNINELLNWLDARHWQARAANFLTGAFNRGFFNIVLSKRSDAAARESDFCFPNVIASVQPGVLQDHASKTASDSGLLGRLIVCEMPDDYLGFPRSIDLQPQVGELVRLLKIVANKDGDVFPPERYAEKLMRMFMEHKARPEPSWRRLCGEYYPRLALILSIPPDDATTAPQITEDGWRKAAVLVQYFFREAERVFGGLLHDPNQAKFEGLCDRILGYVASREGGQCVRSEVAWNIGRGTKAKDRNEAIAELVSRGKLATVDAKSGGVMLVATKNNL